MSRQEELSLKSDKSPRVCFIEKHKQHFIDILLFMEATKMKKYNNCVILSQLFFAMVNSYLIVYCAITCYILGVTFSPGNSNITIIMHNIS